MTREEAQAEAKRRWPVMDCGFGVYQEGWVEENDLVPKGKLFSVGVRRFAVGGEFQPTDMRFFGNGFGDSWESAFADADRREGGQHGKA